MRRSPEVRADGDPLAPDRRDPVQGLILTCHAPNAIKENAGSVKGTDGEQLVPGISRRCPLHRPDRGPQYRLTRGWEGFPSKSPSGETHITSDKRSKTDRSRTKSEHEPTWPPWPPTEDQGSNRVVEFSPNRNNSSDLIFVFLRLSSVRFVLVLGGHRRHRRFHFDFLGALSSWR